MTSFAKTGETMGKEETRLAERRDFQDNFAFFLFEQVTVCSCPFVFKCKLRKEKIKKKERNEVKKQFDRPGEGKETATKETRTLLPPSRVMCVCSPQHQAAHPKTRQFGPELVLGPEKTLKILKKKKKELIWCHILLKKYFIISAKNIWHQHSSLSSEL